MINPKRDSLIALIATLLALTAFAWGLQRLLTLGENDTPGGIAVAIGGLVGSLGLLVLFNFRWALILARRMERGKGVIARWTIPADTVTAYVAGEAARPWADRSRWRPQPGRPAEVLFSNDAVLAGGRFHALSARGLQTFTAVNWVPGTPNLIEFPVTEITSSSAHNYAAGKFVLRVPVPVEANEAATRVLAHFRAALTKGAQSRSQFWKSRRRIGGVALLAGLALAAAGTVMAAQSGWSGNDPLGLIAMVAMIVGVMTAVFGLALTLIATAGMRR